MKCHNATWDGFPGEIKFTISLSARKFYWSFWAKLRKVFTTQTMGHKNPVKGEKIFDVIRISFRLDILGFFGRQMGML